MNLKKRQSSPRIYISRRTLLDRAALKASCKTNADTVLTLGLICPLLYYLINFLIIEFMKYVSISVLMALTARE